MLNTTDIFAAVMLSLIFFVLGIVILALTEVPILVLPLLIAYYIAHYSLKRNIRILNDVKSDYKKLGYELLEEKPIPLLEAEISFKPSFVIINNLPLSRYAYFRRFQRIFTAKSNTGKLYKLYTRNTKHWNGDIEIVIKNKKQIETETRV